MYLLGEVLENRTWTMTPARFLPWALFIPRRGNRRSSWLEKRSDEFNFDFAEFIFNQPSRVCKMIIREGKPGISGQGKNIVFCWILYAYSSYSISTPEWILKYQLPAYHGTGIFELRGKRKYTKIAESNELHFHYALKWKGTELPSMCVKFYIGVQKYFSA